MRKNSHMTSPAEEQQRKEKASGILPAKLGFIKHSDPKTAAILKENFINYLANMNTIGGFNRKNKWPQ